MPKLTDAPAGPCVIDGAVWNELVREVRRLGQWRVTGADFKDEPGGFLLAVREGRGGLFPVRVEKDGGSDGSNVAIASWTYTVRRQDWPGTGTSADYELGTGMVQTRPRPVGKMTVQAGSLGYGVGFYDYSGAFVLWDAGEVPTTGPCP